MFGAIRAETGTCDNTRKFTGKEFDADSNLYYYAARYYDPYIGRFTQRDPIADGVNWYAYTYNNPLRFIDPDGLLQRKLNPHETSIAEEFFGDMINLEQVKINESGIRFSILTRNKTGQYVTVHNTIYGKNMTDDFLIHELVHVWQYKQGRIEPITALGTHIVGDGIEMATGKTNVLYNYRLDNLDSPDRKSFGDYHFETQAAILQDAWLYKQGKSPLYNDEFPKNEPFKRYPYWDAYYDTLIEEWKELHKLPSESSSNYMEYN